MNLFGTKTLLKTCLKPKRSSGNFALKNLTKNSNKWGLNSPLQKLAVLLFLSARTAGGRPPGRPPTVIFFTVGNPRSTGRSTGKKTESRALWSGRPPGRPAQVPAQRAQSCARRSTARACQALFWVRKTC